MTVRRERVVLELEDLFTRDMVKAAAATQLLRRNLKDLSGTSVQTSRDSDRLTRSVRGAGDETERTGSKFRTGANEIDRYSGRVRLLTEAAVVLGPALIPIGAAGVPAVVGLAAGLGTAAGAAGVLLLAVNGLGDALDSIDAYQLEPTTENLAKMRAELDSLGPAGAHFARYLDSLDGQLHSLQDASRAGMFPGVEEGLDHLLSLLPQVRSIIFDIATGMGGLAQDAGESLAGPRFAEFFDYLQSDARPTLEAFGHTLGNVTEGLASLFVAFAPLTRDFTTGMESMSRSFADWAAGLSQTDDFRSFVAYVRESGPQALDLLGALGHAFVGIITAAAPFGTAVLPALTTLSNILAAIANSPIGPPLFTAAAAILAVSRATTLVNKSLVAMRGNAFLASTGIKGLVAAGAALGSVIITANLLQDAMDKLGHTRIDASNLTRDLTALSNGELTDNLSNVASAFMDIGDKWQRDANPLSWISSWDPSGFEAARDTINSLDEALASMVESGDPDRAAQAFDGLAAQAAKVGVSTDEARSRFPQYQAALDNAAAASDNAAAANKRVGASAGRTAGEVRGLTEAMQQQVDDALSAFDAVTRYAEALDAARKRAKQTNAGLTATTAEGRKNRDTLRDMATAWNNQGGAVRNNLAKYAAARDALIQVATQMGATRQKAEQYADTLLDIPKFITTRVDAYTDQAQAKIQAVLNAMAKIKDKDVRLTYYVTQVNAINKGPVTGPGSQNYVGGWTGPGYKYKPVGTVHADEVVIPKELVHRDARMLKARYGFLPGMQNLPEYADGGLVGGGAGGDDTARSVKALQAALDKLTKSLEKETKLRDDILAVRGSVKEGLRSDIFAPTSVWGAQASPNGGLRADIRQGNHFVNLVKQLEHKGVDGAALQEILATGDVARAEMMAALSRKSLGTYERLYNQRERVLSRAGAATTQALGLDDVRDEIRELNRRANKIEQAIKHADQGNREGHKQNARDVTAGVNGAAAAGNRRGHHGR